VNNNISTLEILSNDNSSIQEVSQTIQTTNEEQVVTEQSSEQQTVPLKELEVQQETPKTVEITVQSELLQSETTQITDSMQVCEPQQPPVSDIEMKDTEPVTNLEQNIDTFNSVQISTTLLQENNVQLPDSTITVQEMEEEIQSGIVIQPLPIVNSEDRPLLLTTSLPQFSNESSTIVPFENSLSSPINNVVPSIESAFETQQQIVIDSELEKPMVNDSIDEKTRQTEQPRAPYAQEGTDSFLLAKSEARKEIDFSQQSSPTPPRQEEEPPSTNGSELSSIPLLRPQSNGEESYDPEKPTDSEDEQTEHSPSNNTSIHTSTPFNGISLPTLTKVLQEAASSTTQKHENNNTSSSTPVDCT